MALPRAGPAHLGRGLKRANTLSRLKRGIVAPLFNARLCRPIPPQHEGADRPINARNCSAPVGEWPCMACWAFPIQRLLRRLKASAQTGAHPPTSIDVPQAAIFSVKFSKHDAGEGFEPETFLSERTPLTTMTSEHLCPLNSFCPFILSSVRSRFFSSFFDFFWMGFIWFFLLFPFLFFFCIIFSFPFLYFFLFFFTKMHELFQYR